MVLREYYENSTSLKNESDFKEKIISTWNCDLQKMHSHHIIDFMLLYGGVAKAWVEVKCLNKTHNKYPFTILSLSKYMKGIDYFNKTGLPFIFATRLLDGDYYFKYRPDYPKFEIIWGGRTKQTRDKYDIEPIIKIPMVFFEVF